MVDIPLVNPTHADDQYFTDNPSAQWRVREPFEGEWHGFKVMDELRNIAANVAESMMEVITGRNELRVVVFRVAPGLSLVRWPASIHHDEPEKKRVKVYWPDPEAQTVAAMTAEMLHEVMVEAYERGQKEGKPIADPKTHLCLVCDKEFGTADIIVSVHGIMGRVACEECWQKDELDIDGIGLYMMKDLESCTPEERVVVDKALARVEEIRAQCPGMKETKEEFH